MAPPGYRSVTLPAVKVRLALVFTGFGLPARVAIMGTFSPTAVMDHALRVPGSLPEPEPYGPPTPVVICRVQVPRTSVPNKATGIDVVPGLTPMEWPSGVMRE